MRARAVAMGLLVRSPTPGTRTREPKYCCGPARTSTLRPLAPRSAHVWSSIVRTSRTKFVSQILFLAPFPPTNLPFATEIAVVAANPVAERKRVIEDELAVVVEQVHHRGGVGHHGPPGRSQAARVEEAIVRVERDGESATLGPTPAFACRLRRTTPQLSRCQ